MFAILLALLPLHARDPTPVDAVALQVEDVTPAGDAHIVFLVNGAHTRIVPIEVEEPEAVAVAYALAGRERDPPGIHALFGRFAAQARAHLEEVHIHSFRRGTFWARLTYRMRRRKLHVEARAADAIVLALHAGVPIHMARGIYEGAGVEIADLIRVMREEGTP